MDLAKKIFSLFAVAVILISGIFFIFSSKVTAGGNYNAVTGQPDNTYYHNEENLITNNIGLGNENPKVIIANIVNILLGFLGIVAVIIIMYAGFVWMTSNGNPDKINKAKKMLLGAVIGLIIIISAFSIVAFIINSMWGITGGSIGSGSGSGASGFPGSGHGSYGSGGPGTSGSGAGVCDGDTTTPRCDADDSMCPPNYGCDSDCICRPNLTTSCFNPMTDTCSLLCRAGYDCLGSSCGGDSCHNHDCYCCCDTTNDQCSLLYSTLTCRADVIPECTGNHRGRCCGCAADNQCGNPASDGCGTDTCCYPRPEVIATEPTANETDVCPNGQITVEFSQRMSFSSFADNILLFGEYNDSCPANTTYITKNDIKQIKGTKQKNLLSLIKETTKFIFNKQAQAQTTPIYCAVNLSLSAYNQETYNAATGLTFVHTIAIIRPTGLLDNNKVYHLLIKGNTKGATAADLPNNGILNYAGVGLQTTNNYAFNGVTYENAYSFSFTTLADQGGNKGLCVIDHIDISPDSYLFQTTNNAVGENDSDITDPSFDSVRDRDKVFIAKAVSKDNSVLVPIAGVYDWTWNWNSSNPSVAEALVVSGLSDDMRLIQAQPDIVDGRTIVSAGVNLLASPPAYATPPTPGEADVFVFTCENPWPTIQNDGTWAPWSDTTSGSCANGACVATNFQIYYCRDLSPKGTYNDLPAMEDDATTPIVGAHGENVEQVQFYVASNPHAGSALTAVVRPEGGSIDLSWGASADANNGYRVYWGRNSGNYIEHQDVSGTNITIDGLQNNRTYYFNVTAINSDGAESELFGEISAMPTDTVGPANAPHIDNIKSDTPTTVELTWSYPSTDIDDVKSYEVAYGVVNGQYGYSKNIGMNNGVIIKGLTTGRTYYFVVRALDKYGNKSANSNEVSIMP